MAKPLISWKIATLDANGNIIAVAPMSKWEPGVVEADGQPHGQTTIFICNNIDGTSAVSDMTDCYITTVDANFTDGNAGNAGELISGKWVQVKLPGEASYTQIGGTTTTKTIKAVADTVQAGVIKGSVPAQLGQVIDENGNLVNTENIARVDMQLVVPPTATAGIIDFNIRVGYRYV